MEKNGKNRVEGLLKAVNDSDPQRASDIYENILSVGGGDPWEAHRSLYPVVQRVLNPPYINPHLPKMYAVYPELAGYLKEEDIPALVRLEITEYARRKKLEESPRPGLPESEVAFRDIEAAVRDRDRETAANLMASFCDREGGREFARRLLILGSGYLDASLDHSISCTAFMLRELLDRDKEDPWPVIFALAHYFCRGRFHVSPAVTAGAPTDVQDDTATIMASAASGQGIINLHHTITFYALDRVRYLFTGQEYNNLFGAVVRFMGEKDVEDRTPRHPPGEPPPDYAGFFETFSEMNAASVLSSISPLTSSKDGRRALGRYLIKGICELYQGDYDPHFITGLGSLLWVLETCPDDQRVCMNALYQYLDYYFQGLK